MYMYVHVHVYIAGNVRVVIVYNTIYINHGQEVYMCRIDLCSE